MPASTARPAAVAKSPMIRRRSSSVAARVNRTACGANTRDGASPAWRPTAAATGPAWPSCMAGSAPVRRTASVNRRQARARARAGPRAPSARRGPPSTPRRTRASSRPTPPLATARWKSISSSLTSRPLPRPSKVAALTNRLRTSTGPSCAGWNGSTAPVTPRAYHPTEIGALGRAMRGRARQVTEGVRASVDEPAHRPPGDAHRLGAPGGAAEHEATLDRGDQRDRELCGRGPIDRRPTRAAARPRRPSCRTRRRWRPAAGRWCWPPRARRCRSGRRRGSRSPRARRRPRRRSRSWPRPGRPPRRRSPRRARGRPGPRCAAPRRPGPPCRRGRSGTASRTARRPPR